MAIYYALNRKPKMLLLSCSLLLIGAAYVYWIREALFISPSIYLTPDAQLAEIGGNLIPYGQNLNSVKGFLSGHSSPGRTAIWLYISLLTVYAWLIYRASGNTQLLALTLSLFTYLVSMAIFANVIEARIYQPFALCTAYLLVRALRDSPATSSSFTQKALHKP